MIVGLAPHVVPLAFIRAHRGCARAHSVAICGECGTAAGSPLAHACTRTDCALSVRHHHEEASAA